MSDPHGYLRQSDNPRDKIDPRNYIVEVDTHTKNAIDLATGIDPAQNAAVHAQVALAKAIAGLAAALLATDSHKPSSDH